MAAALDHREPDRVPIDVGVSRISGISAIAYKSLLQSLGRSDEGRLTDGSPCFVPEGSEPVLKQDDSVEVCMDFRVDAEELKSIIRMLENETS